MNVASIMTRKMIMAEMDDSLFKVRNFFKYAEFHHILVVEDRKLVGVISDRDLLAEEGRDTINSNKRTHQIMSRMPITVDAQTSIEKASNLLLENNISCLPVVSSQGVVEGILTWKDILKFYMKNKTVTDGVV
jgi:acetoin utilization protein AcuB